MGYGAEPHAKLAPVSCCVLFAGELAVLAKPAPRVRLGLLAVMFLGVLCSHSLPC